MKSFSTSLAMALALMPTAWALDSTTVYTTYTESNCTTGDAKSATNTYVQGISTDEQAVADACTASAFSCLPGVNGSYYSLSCEGAIVDLMGTNAGTALYADADCSTAYMALWSNAADGVCFESFSGSINTYTCDTTLDGYVDQNTCTSDCDGCTVTASSPTTCTALGDGTSFKGQCYSASSSSSDDVCFSGDDSVTLESGATKLFSELVIGDNVQTADANGALSFSNVVALPHAVNNKLASFVNVVTASGKSLKATKMHLLQQCDGSLAYAGSLSKGDCLRTVDGDEAVTALSMTKAEGIYTAVTTNEFLVVNGIVASPFAVTHGLVNSFYNLHRTVAKFMPTALASPLALAVNAFLGGSFLAAGNSK